MEFIWIYMDEFWMSYGIICICLDSYGSIWLMNYYYGWIMNSLYIFSLRMNYGSEWMMNSYLDGLFGSNCLVSARFPNLWVPQ